MLTKKMKVQPESRDGVSITVCVPVYNVERYLRECLDSIFSQDYLNFDVVMVDDGSTDSSGAICDEYAARYPYRALVIHKTNEGSFLARREGFARAKGQYVMCVDSDDALAPNALSVIATAVSETDTDVVRFGFTRKRVDVPPSVDVTRLRVYPAEEKPAMLRSLCRSTSGSENPMWFKVVRRECVGADMDFAAFKGLTFAEDFLQTLVVYDRADSFCFLDACLYFYRPGTGITRVYNRHFYQDVCRCLDVAEGYARRWEHEYTCDGLLTGLAACRLDSAAQYAEWLAFQGDRVGLESLRASKDFQRCSAAAGTGGLLRVDRRIVLGALRLKIYPLIAVLAKVKAAKAEKCRAKFEYHTNLD